MRSHICASRASLLGLVIAFLGGGQATSASEKELALDYRIELTTIRSGFDRKTEWYNPSAAIIPGTKPVVILLITKALLGTSDVYFSPSGMQSDDLGRTWSEPMEYSALLRRNQGGGVMFGLSTLLPKWNPPSRVVLGIGTVSYYVDDKRMVDPPDHTAYALYDSARRSWSPWNRLTLPSEAKFYFTDGGCGQRVDLPKGDILVPIYFKAKGTHPYTTTVLRCSFDGSTLSYRSHGDELTLPFDPSTLPPSLDENQRWFISRQSGLFEPSLTFFGNRYYMTMRNAKMGYVVSGHDGTHFDSPRPWTFDNGDPLGSDNTQTRWVTHSDGLFLVYTRRGARNDHVFRHRAPLFMAQVDPARLCVIRATERILIPERGASLGTNFNVMDLNERESWVTTSESMNGPNGGILSLPPHLRADNSVYAARIVWNKANMILSSGLSPY